MTAKALSVDAQLSLIGDRGEAVDVSADGTNVSVGVPGLWTAARLGRRLSRRRRLAVLRQAQQWLTRADLMVEFQVGDDTLALLGPQARPGWLSRAMGLHPLELRLSAILTSLFRRGQR